jgi:hypothetical protein
MALSSLSTLTIARWGSLRTTEERSTLRGYSTIFSIKNIRTP